MQNATGAVLDRAVEAWRDGADAVDGQLNPAGPQFELNIVSADPVRTVTWPPCHPSFRIPDELAAQGRC